MTSQQFIVCDNSTAANFVAWASPISNFFRTAGWTNTTDTGQLNGAGAGNWAGVTTIPAANSGYYEIFQPGDGLTAFYVKVEYGNFGNSSATNSPGVRTTVGTGTNGAGTLTGFVTTSFGRGGIVTAPSTTTTYECNFSGDSGRIHIMMWRNAPNNVGIAFSIERSVNSSGTYTGTHVTSSVMFYGGNTASWNGTGQQSILFGVGVAPLVTAPGTTSPNGGFPCRLRLAGSSSGPSGAFNGSIPLDTAAPYVGYWDYPLTGIGIGQATDYADGVTFTVTLYGSTRTYVAANSGAFQWCAPNTGVGTFCMRYD